MTRIIITIIILPDEKVFYLTEGEIKMILTSELRRQGFAFADYNCVFFNDSSKTKRYKVIEVKSKTKYGWNILK